MKLYYAIKKMLKMPTSLEVAAIELSNAELELLKAETGVDWAQASVTYNKNRIKRLKAYITTEEVKEAA
jgi:hypothetical protein